MKRRNKNRKEPKAETLVMAVKTAMNQTERKMPRGTQVKGTDLQLLWKGGASHTRFFSDVWAPSVPCPGYKVPHMRRNCSKRHTPEGFNSQDNQNWRCLGVPTEAPILITPEEHSINNCGVSRNFWGRIKGANTVSHLKTEHGTSLETLYVHWSPGPLSSWSTAVMELSGWAK